MWDSVSYSRALWYVVCLGIGPPTFWLEDDLHNPLIHGCPNPQQIWETANVIILIVSCFFVCLFVLLVYKSFQNRSRIFYWGLYFQMVNYANRKINWVSLSAVLMLSFICPLMLCGILWFYFLLCTGLHSPTLKRTCMTCCWNQMKLECLMVKWWAPFGHLGGFEALSHWFSWQNGAIAIA